MIPERPKTHCEKHFKGRLAEGGEVVRKAELDRKLAPQVGFEPTTNRLTADRSTTELLRSAYEEAEPASSMGTARSQF